MSIVLNGRKKKINNDMPPKSSPRGYLPYTEGNYAMVDEMNNKKKKGKNDNSISIKNFNPANYQDYQVVISRISPAELYDLRFFNVEQLPIGKKRKVKVIIDDINKKLYINRGAYTRRYIQDLINYFSRVLPDSFTPEMRKAAEEWDKAHSAGPGKKDGDADDHAPLGTGFAAPVYGTIVPDGSKKIVRPDGTIMFIAPDGTKV